MPKVYLTVELLNQVLNYLGSRPYQEVYQIIPQIQKTAEEQLNGPSPTLAAPATADTDKATADANVGQQA